MVSRRQPARSTRGGKTLTYAEDSSSDSSASDAASPGSRGGHVGGRARVQAEQMPGDIGADVPTMLLMLL